MGKTVYAVKGSDMSKKEKNEISMKWRMIGIMLMCWLLPFCLIIGVAGYYILSNRYGTVAQGVVDQVVYDGQICVERLNHGINASRKATYDQTLEKAWRLPRQFKLWWPLYREQ